MKKFIQIAFATLLLTACSAIQLQEALTKAEAGAWTIANAYETVNTATGGTLTTNLLNSALKATHNTPDSSLVDTAGQLADAAIDAQLAAKKAGADNAGQQAAVTNVLSNTGVINAAAAVAPASMQVPAGT